MPKTNAAGVSLIESFEGLSLTAYQDSVGVWTIGYGHTGPDVQPGQVISSGEAQSLLEADLAVAEACVSRLVEVTLTPNQFSALVSFTYNLGCGALQTSTLLRLVNANEMQAASSAFSRWSYAGGQWLSGLYRRRMAESALFLRP